MSNEELVSHIQQGENVRELLAELWLQNKAFVSIVARRYFVSGNGIEFEDLMQQGYLGLERATRTYNTDGDIKFMTYADAWIKQSIGRYIADCGHIIRLPERICTLLRKYKRYSNDFANRNSREATLEEMRKGLGLTPTAFDDLQRVITTVGNVTSLNKEIDSEDGNSTTVGDLLPGEESHELRVVEKSARAELKQSIDDVIESLPQMQAKVIQLRYFEGKTREAVKATLNISDGEERTLHTEALKAFRRNPVILQYDPRMRRPARVARSSRAAVFVNDNTDVEADSLGSILEKYSI